MRIDNFPLYKLPGLLWRERFRVITAISACILIAGVIALMMKPEYEAKTTLSPASGVWQGELIAGAGGIINRVNEARLLDGFSPLSLSFQKAEAIGILRSNFLAADLIKQQKLLPIFFPNKWRPGGFTGNTKDGRPNATISEGVDYFSREIRRVKFNTKSGLITLEITAPTAALAVKWSKQLVALANNYCRKRAIYTAQRNVAYLKRQLVNITDFREQRVIAHLIRSQLDAETIASGSKQYALKVIDPPAEPQVPAFPRPLQILSFGTAFGVIVAIWLALARDHSGDAEEDERTFANHAGVPTHLGPTFIAMASAAGGLLLTLFPPDAYSHIIGEPDLMFLDPCVYLFVGLCLAAYLFGNHLASKMTAIMPVPVVTDAGTSGVRQRLAIAFAVVGATISVVVAGIYVRNAHGYLSALEQGGAQAIRAAALASLLNNGFIATNVLPVGFPLLLWSAGNIGAEQGKGYSFGVRWAVYTCALIYGLCCIITLSRSLLMPYFLAILVVLSGTLWHRRGIALKKLITTVAGILGVVIALFLIIAYFRSGATQSPLTMLAGYVPASYNRLAAVLMGRLTPSISGAPYYSFRFLWYPPVVRRILAIPHIGRDFGWPIPNSMMTGWFSEFSHVASADLNPIFIWPTAFGYTFYDFGWWAPIYFIAVGYLANCLWREFIAGTAYGLILYSYLIASILLWSTDNFLALPGVWVMFGVSTILAILEKRLLCPPASVAAERRFPSISG